MRPDVFAQWTEIHRQLRAMGLHPIAGGKAEDPTNPAGAGAAKIPEKFLNPDGTPKVDAIVQAYTDLEGKHTKESQEWAARGKDIERLQGWDEWRRKDWPVFEADYRRLKELEGQGFTPKEAKAIVKDERRLEGDLGSIVQQLTVDDFLDDKRLRTALNGYGTAMLTSSVQQAEAALKKWWQETELQRLDQTAYALTNTILGLLGVVWPKDLPPIGEVLKAATAANEQDFAKVLAGMSTSRKSIEDPAYERGRKAMEDELRQKGQLRDAAESPTGGGGLSSTWNPPPNAGGTDDQVFAEVMREVSAKHGTPLPL